MKKQISRTWWLRIFAVGFSLLLWIYVTSSLKVEADKTVKLSYALPADIAIKSDIVDEVVVTLKGPHSLLRKKSSELKSIVVNLEKIYNPRKKKVIINTKTLDLQLPYGIEVKKIEPARIEIEFDRKIWKKVPVKYSTIAELPEELRFIKVNQTIKKVKITGPRSVLRNIGKLTLDPIDLSKVDQTTTFKKAVELDDARVQVEPNEVDVEYVVKPNQSNLRLTNIPIQFLTTHSISNVSIQKVTVLLLVNDEKKAKNIVPSDVSVIAKLPTNAEGEVTVPLQVQMPAGVALLKTIPDTVKVFIQRKL
jgi:YbbR domain-containing protein